MLLLTVLSTSLAASPSVLVMPVDIGGVYLKRAELLLPAVKQGLTSGGLTLVSDADAEAAVDGKRSLLTCTTPAKKCIVALVQALPAEGSPATVVIRSQLSREPYDGHGVLLQAYSLPEGRLLGTFYEGGTEGEEALARVLTSGARQLASDLIAVSTASAGVPSEAPSVHSTRTEPLFRKVAWGLLAASLATGLFGLVSVIHRINLLSEEVAGEPSLYAEYRYTTYKAAEEQRISAVASFAVSGAIMVPAVILLYLGFKQKLVSFDLIPGTTGPTLTLVPGLGGASFSLVGTF